jgi:hypothetical protein
MADVTNDAQQLCDLFTRLATEVDAFRTAHYDELSPQRRGELEEQIQQLYDFHDKFAGDVIQSTLNSTQGDLAKLIRVTQQASDALKHLETVERAVNIASAAANLAQAITSAGYGQIPDAVRGLVQAIQGAPDEDSSES